MHDITMTCIGYEDKINTKKIAINIKDRNLQEDVKKLLVVMQNLAEIEEEKESVMLKLDEQEQTIRTLSTVFDFKMENDMKLINKLQEEWKNLLLIATRVDKDILGQKKVEKEKTKEKIKKFEDTLKIHLLELKKKTFYVYKTGIEDSLREINGQKH